MLSSLPTAITKVDSKRIPMLREEKVMEEILRVRSDLICLHKKNIVIILKGHKDSKMKNVHIIINA
jgi:hypothetical protein